MYSGLLLDHFENPRNLKELLAPSFIVAVENPICGDQLRISVECFEKKIVRASFRARGCTASIACGSALTELLIGCSAADLKRLDAAAIDAAIGGLIPESKHAAVLCADAVRKLEAEWKTS
ncbi:iron-sulfur cluster assembly scaffold protein [Bryobacter aggregatus]|uniref:iron-sulfur cluster assembly scaffold protein n=1 Tax=Bryobacter aggregatus TaxID=360054 RepID=UPI0004E21680